MTLDRTPACGARRADLLEQVEEALGVAEPPHPAQHRAAGVLEGQVEVRRDAGRRRHRLDQAGPHLGRLQVGHPHPLDAVDRGQLGQQRLEQPQVAEVLAVRRGVLADQDQLAHALLGQPARLGEHLGRAPRDERAAEGRDRAERAAPVAAATPASAAAIGPSPRRLRSGRGPDAGATPAGRSGARVAGRCRRAAAAGRPGASGSSVRRSRGTCGTCAVAGEDVAAAGRRCRRSRRSRARRRPRAALGQLLAVPLGQAADRDDRLGAPAALEVGRGQQRVDRVLLGRLDEAAGVDHHDVGVGRRRRPAPAVGREPAGELLGVDLVAGAAQGDERDAPARRGGGGHCASVTAVCGPADSQTARQPAAGSSGVNCTRATWPWPPGAPISVPLTVEVDAAGVADDQLEPGLVGERLLRSPRCSSPWNSSWPRVRGDLDPAAVGGLHARR